MLMLQLLLPTPAALAAATCFLLAHSSFRALASFAGTFSLGPEHSEMPLAVAEDLAPVAHREDLPSIMEGLKFGNSVQARDSDLCALRLVCVETCALRRVWVSPSRTPCHPHLHQ